VQTLARDFLKNYFQVTIGSLELTANHMITQVQWTPFGLNIDAIFWLDH
jgi:hypothetical protein